MPTTPSVQWLRKHILFPKPLGLFTFLRSVKAFAISFRFICHPQVFHCHGNYCNDQNEADPYWFIHPPKTPSISLVFYRFELLILATRRTFCRANYMSRNQRNSGQPPISGSMALCYSASSMHSLHGYIYPECSCEM